ncbi:MAG: patatin-like phospholipase family protein [Gammaproteobacteria bacterium]|nr:patatin-like phospholipase family protein [Gammaproteobacteria bacterium]
MIQAGPLLFKAGPAAFDDIRRRGFSAERIGTIAGASGGAKWLVLSQIDRVLIDKLLPKLAGPVHLLGSSIGAWRFACYGQSDPLAALERLEYAYLNQTYSEKPDAAEITAKSREILREVLGQSGPRQILSNPQLRTHIMTVRSRAMTASDRRPLLMGSLLVAAAANTVSRRSLGAFFTRGLFYDGRELPPFYNASGFPIERIELTERNLQDAVVASGSIPLVLDGVRDIPDAPAGTYRDGGIIDYHLDLPLSEPDRLTLFPHFFEQLVPGWFDKRLPWRRFDPRHTDRSIVICPSTEFISRLPGGKVPDRSDFVTMSPSDRREAWQATVDACRELADDLAQVLDNGGMEARLLPL